MPSAQSKRSKGTINLANKFSTQNIDLNHLPQHYFQIESKQPETVNLSSLPLVITILSETEQSTDPDLIEVSDMMMEHVNRLTEEIENAKKVGTDGDIEPLFESVDLRVK